MQNIHAIMITSVKLGLHKAVNMFNNKETEIFQKHLVRKLRVYMYLVQFVTPNIIETLSNSLVNASPTSCYFVFNLQLINNVT
jgi:hypothetical protein